MIFRQSIVLVLIVLTCAYACAPSPAPSSRSSEPMAEQLTLDYRACTIDTDCVLALNGCCDCANGGRDIAIARDKASDFNARFHCAGPCTERGGSCGDGTIACENKRCVYREPTQP